MSTKTRLGPLLVVAALAAGSVWYSTGGFSNDLDEGDVQLDLTWPSTPQIQVTWGYKPGPDSTSEIGSGGHWRKRIHLKAPGTYVVTLSGRPIPKPVRGDDGVLRRLGSTSTCIISTKDGQKTDRGGAEPGSMCAVTHVVVVHHTRGS